MLERLLQSQAKFLFIGDHGQLPPVESKLISPTLESPNHTLTEIVRQAKDSPIREFAYSVRQGASLRATPEGISLHRVRSTESIAEQCHANGTDMIIVATNRLRAALNSSIRRLRGMTGNTFAEGEQVLILATAIRTKCSMAKSTRLQQSAIHPIGTKRGRSLLAIWFVLIPASNSIGRPGIPVANRSML